MSYDRAAEVAAPQHVVEATAVAAVDTEVAAPQHVVEATAVAAVAAEVAATQHVVEATAATAVATEVAAISHILEPSDTGLHQGMAISEADATDIGRKIALTHAFINNLFFSHVLLFI